jgi:nitrogen fixation NifU-like protein
VYGELIQEHFRRPRNYGPLEAADIRNEDFNPLCGDRVRIEVALNGETIREARFQGDLCMIAKAATSLLTEMIAGAPLESITDFPDQRLIDALGAEIPQSRHQCALLGLRVLQAGVEQWRNACASTAPPSSTPPGTRSGGS